MAGPTPEYVRSASMRSSTAVRSRKAPFALECMKRSALLQSALAQSASQITLTRPWHYQITICDREEAPRKLGGAERRSRFRSRKSHGDRAQHGGGEDPEETKNPRHDLSVAKAA